MWLFTTVGFFSIVKKKGTAHLTVRARVRSDLERLREKYLPELSPTKETPGNDYRYRGTASHADVVHAIGKIVADLQYSNFKSEVAATLGHEREHVYHDVWGVLDEKLPPLDAKEQSRRRRAKPPALCPPPTRTVV